MGRVGISILSVLLFGLFVATGWAMYRFSLENTASLNRKPGEAARSDPKSPFNLAATEPFGSGNSARPGETKTDPPKIKPVGPIDVALIDPNGTSVIAGSAKPNSEVVISADGVEVATTISDDNGDWVLTTNHRFESSKPEFNISTRSNVQSQPMTPDLEKPGLGRHSIEPPLKTELSPQENVAERLTEEFEQIVEAARRERVSTSGQVPEERSNDSLKQADTSPVKSISEERPAVARVVRAERETTKTKLPVQTNAIRTEKNMPLEIPIPIGFVYRTAEFTEQGKRAVRLLAEYLTIKKPASITLTGHADERGSKQLNMGLSKERLDAVAIEIKNNGYSGALELIARGEESPYLGVDRSKLLKEDLYALDRRVELKLFQ